VLSYERLALAKLHTMWQPIDGVETKKSINPMAHCNVRAQCVVYIPGWSWGCSACPFGTTLDACQAVGVPNLCYHSIHHCLLQVTGKFLVINVHGVLQNSVNRGVQEPVHVVLTKSAKMRFQRAA